MARICRSDSGATWKSWPPSSTRRAPAGSMDSSRSRLTPRLLCRLAPVLQGVCPLFAKFQHFRTILILTVETIENTAYLSFQQQPREFDGTVEMIEFQELSSDQRREAINTQQRYAAYREAAERAKGYRGS